MDGAAGVLVGVGGAADGGGKETTVPALLLLDSVILISIPIDAFNGITMVDRDAFQSPLHEIVFTIGL